MPKQAKKKRLDLLVTEAGLVESREQAKRQIMAGEVLVNDQLVVKPSTQVDITAKITLKAKPRFVSRGGEKLVHAIEIFGISLENLVCADVGASTGGFTDCMLQSGAAKVYAIDVGYGQLAWSLRNHERVVVMERVNVRYLERLPEQVDFISIDVSFISLNLILPVVSEWLSAPGTIVALIKPQFEAGKSEVGKGGVVRDPNQHRQVISDVILFAEQANLNVIGLTTSPIKGPSGNIEFLLWLSSTSKRISPHELEGLVETTVRQAHIDLNN